MLQTADYLSVAWRGRRRAEAAPCPEPAGEYVTADLTMTSGRFVLRSSEEGKAEEEKEGKNLGLVW